MGTKWVDHAVKTLSLLAAIAFVYSAAFLYGELSGANQITILPYLTFADFVNSAPSTMTSFGITLMILVLDQSPTASLPDWWMSRLWLRLLVTLTLFAGLYAAATHYGVERAIWVIYGIFAATGLLSELVRQDFENSLGPRWGRVARNSVRILWLPVAFGFGFGWLMTVGSQREVICTTHGIERGTGKLALDRGLVLFDHDRFQILPWNSVVKIDGTGVEKIDNRKSGNAAEKLNCAAASKNSSS